MSESQDRPDAGSSEANRPDFEPTREPDDEFFAVVGTEYLRELVDVFRPTNENAVFLVREGVGVKARSRSEACYWFEVEIPADVFDVFQPSDTDVTVDTGKLTQVVDGLNVPRVALHGKPDGSVYLFDGRDRYDFQGTEHPLVDPDEERDSEVDGNLRNRLQLEMAVPVGLSVTVEAADLKALVGADDAHEYAGVIVDGTDGTVEAFFFDDGDDSRTISLELGPDRVVSSPTTIADTLDEDDIVSQVTERQIETAEDICPEFDDDDAIAVPICRESIDKALTPMAGDVEIAVPLFVGLMSTSLQYERAGGELQVYVCLSRAPSLELDETWDNVVPGSIEYT